MKLERRAVPTCFGVLMALFLTRRPRAHHSARGRWPPLASRGDICGYLLSFRTPSYEPSVSDSCTDQERPFAGLAGGLAMLCGLLDMFATAALTDRTIPDSLRTIR